MNLRFELYRFVGNRFVEGWLAPEVLRILSIIDAEQRASNHSGAVAEIGVHHGRLFIGIQLMQPRGLKSVAIDVFGDQQLNVDKSGKGDLEKFKQNVRRWSSLEDVTVHQGDSTALVEERLLEIAGSRIRFFSVDGGHTADIVLSDMMLAEATLAQGGVVIADDVFNEEWPGVATGTIRYLQDGKLVPFAVGFNKVFFARPEDAELYRRVLAHAFANTLTVFTRSSDFASHEVVILRRVRRRPKALLGRSRRVGRIAKMLRGS